MSKVLFRVMLILGMTVLYSCNKEDNKEDNKVEDVKVADSGEVSIVGKWQVYKIKDATGHESEPTYGTRYYMFYSDGTVVETLPLGYEEIRKTKGTYSIFYDVLKIKTTNTTPFDICDLTDDQLTLSLGEDEYTSYFYLKKVYDFNTDTILGKWIQDYYRLWNSSTRKWGDCWIEGNQNDTLIFKEKGVGEYTGQIWDPNFEYRISGDSLNIFDQDLIIYELTSDNFVFGSEIGSNAVPGIWGYKRVK